MGCLTSMFFIRSLKSSWLIALLLFVNANPSLAWDAFPVGESVTLMQSGTDYNVEISCAKTNGSKLRLEIRRVYPPIDEIERISSVTLHIYTGTSLAFAQEIAVALTTDRDIMLTGFVDVAMAGLESLASGSKLDIIDNATGRIIFSSPMHGTSQGRTLFKERCGI